jgi:hypothetical protein
MNRRTAIGISLLCLGILAAIPSIYGIQTSFTVGNSGSISMVKLYWDSQATNEVTHVDWGSIIPGDIANRTIYIKNFGGVPVNITLTIENWNPANASSYITFNDDISGSSIAGHFVQQCHLFLSISPDIVNTTISTFSFDVRVNEGW